VEEFAAGSAIARRYERLTGQSVDGAREVIARSEAQDSRAHAIATSAAQALGSAIAWAVDIVDPQIIVLGGGLGSSGGWWVNQVRTSYIRLSRPRAPEVVLAALGADSGVIGAALAARLQDGSPEPRLG
jgi:glucokinase